MKRFFSLLLAAVTLATVTACNDGLNKSRQMVRQAGAGTTHSSRSTEQLAEEILQSVKNRVQSVEKNKQSVDDGSTATPTDWQSVGLPKANITLTEQVLERTGYVASYNADNRIPNWVMWQLTADHASGPYKRDGVKFTPDSEVSNSPTTYDYQRTGYDRGHMCPSADNRWSAQAQQDCFLMTNICPQNHNLNTGDWSEMETQCRRWAERYGEIFIICGPVLFRSEHKKIARSIVVPEAFFKVVYCPSRQKAIGFIYRNEAGNRPKGDYVNSVDEVERITGLDFFPNLPKEIQDPLEASASWSDWQD